MYFAVTLLEEGIQFCYLISTEPLNLYISMLSIEIIVIVHFQAFCLHILSIMV